MTEEKKNLVSSSMIELKAELFRKQEEFKRQKAAGANSVKGKISEKKNVKGSLWSRQNPGVLARAQKDVETKSAASEEDEELLAKSKKMLEEKSRLYEKLTNSSTIPEEDGSDYYLVDFQKKVIDSIVEGREAARNRQEEEEDEAERQSLADAMPEPSTPDEEWVDFTDSLGRERRCMRKDLDQLMKRDRELALSQSSKKSVKEKNSSSQGEAVRNTEPHLLSQDMHRELMRQKWEAEAQELLEKGQEEIHYSNVQFDEIRGHGVGFYQFSKDSQKREEELENLKKLHEETVDERSRKDRIKDKRKAMMEARLAKVRQRRKLKGADEGDKPDDVKDEEIIGPKLSEASTLSEEDRAKKEAEEKEAEEKRKTHIREWDKHKKSSSWSGKNYVEQRRDEREEEFAPPAVYFDGSKDRVEKETSDDARLKRLQTSVKMSSSESAGFVNAATALDAKSSIDKAENQSTQQHISRNNQISSTVSFPHEGIPQESASWTETNMSGNNYWNSSHPAGYIHPQLSSGDQQMPQVLPPATQYGVYNRYGPTPYTEPQNTSTDPQVYNAYPNYQPYAQEYNQQYQYGSNPQGGQTYNMNHQQQMGQNTKTFPNYHSQLSSSDYVTAQPPETWTGQGNKRDLPNSKEETVVKKVKVPKMAIIDTRFVKNDEVPTLDATQGVDPQVTAVPYTPGSFTAAKQSVAHKYEEYVAESTRKEHISGGPLLYTSEQQKQQQEILDKGKDENDEQDPDAEKKLQDFLTSIRTGQS